MKSTLVILTACSIVFCTVTAGLAQAPKVPWVSLFNGQDLAGWKKVGSNGHVEAVDGMIVCHQVVNTPMHTLFHTEKTFGDFILEMDVMTDPGFSSGILFRCAEQEPNSQRKTRDASLYGYQAKIDPSKRAWTGGIYDYFGKTFDWLYPLDKDERARKAYKIGEWNHFRIEAIGTTLKVWVNGVPTSHLIHDKYRQGYIALKIHSLKDQPEKEKNLGRFKNIKILTDQLEEHRQAMDIPARVVAATSEK
ncbi:DUF1080 domain-containing protein [Planctomycetota bacterium]